MRAMAAAKASGQRRSGAAKAETVAPKWLLSVRDRAAVRIAGTRQPARSHSGAVSLQAGRNVQPDLILCKD
jgi:hypothetical protein